jgi:hypothetical protein
MKIKGTQSIRVCITEAGTIGLEQLDEIMGTFVYVYLSLEQFNSLESWVFKNKDEIESLWNGGVDDAPET